MDLHKQRKESLQIGSIAAVAFCLAYGVVILLLYLLPGIEPLAFTGIKIVAAGIEGFVFGITYRYIVRNDQNPFLRDGAVLAFALVRGLAPLEIVTDWRENLSLLLMVGGESFICFAIARFALDLTMAKMSPDEGKSNQ